MFDFHAHLGSDNSDAFISLVRKREADSITPYSSIGFLPWLDEMDESEIENIISSNPSLMVGEFGLDKTKGELSHQMDAFYFMAELARDYSRWAVIHSVRTTELILSELKALKVKNAIFHSYTGSYESAKMIASAGYLISLSPRSLKTRNIDKLLTLPFLLESDMETGKEQKKTIINLYGYVSEKVDFDLENRLKQYKDAIWKSSF